MEEKTQNSDERAVSYLNKYFELSFDEKKGILSANNFKEVWDGYNYDIKVNNLSEGSIKELEEKFPDTLPLSLKTYLEIPIEIREEKINELNMIERDKKETQNCLDIEKIIERQHNSHFQYKIYSSFSDKTYVLKKDELYIRTAEKNPYGEEFNELFEIKISLTDLTEKEKGLLKQVEGLPYLAVKHLKEGNVNFSSPEIYIKEIEKASRNSLEVFIDSIKETFKNMFSKNKDVIEKPDGTISEGIKEEMSHAGAKILYTPQGNLK